MGIEVGPTYTTEQGFQLSPLYVSVTTFRFLLTPDGVTYHCIFEFQGYKSREDKRAGRSALSLPRQHSHVETMFNTREFQRYDIFELAYRVAKQAFAGYTVQDVYEPNQVNGSTFCFNAQGVDIDGFNTQGYDADGYNREGFNAQGYNREGYDINGYDAQGYNAQGFNQAGYDRDGYDYAGYNAQGVDRDGNPRPPYPSLTP